MGILSLVEAAVLFAEVSEEITKSEHVVIAKACVMIAEEAKHVLGTDGYGWPPLSPNTKKTQPGMLLETGEMRDSIEWTAEEKEGWVGSNNDKAVWHELGTAKIPARTFLLGAAIAKLPEITAMAGATVVARIRGVK
jgi:phage gpG-like protein